MTRQKLDLWLLPWPGVTQDIKWGNDLVYSVAGKMFAVLSLQPEDGGPVSFKAEQDRFIELTARPGIAPAPYLARHFWVAVSRDQALATDEWTALLRTSYELVVAKLPRRTHEGL